MVVVAVAVVVVVVIGVVVVVEQAKQALALVCARIQTFLLGLRGTGREKKMDPFFGVVEM